MAEEDFIPLQGSAGKKERKERVKYVHLRPIQPVTNPYHLKALHFSSPLSLIQRPLPTSLRTSHTLVLFDMVSSLPTENRASQRVSVM